MYIFLGFLLSVNKRVLFFFFTSGRSRTELWDLSLPRGGTMADAFGDDLFSVFDDEQSTSSKKTSSKPESRVGYVVKLSVICVIALHKAVFCHSACLFTGTASARDWTLTV